jgi:hypothetical protein
MSYQQKPNSGAIFKNDKKKKETQPDYSGTINVEGKDWQISLWVKDGKSGKFFSASIKEPYVKGTQEKTFTETKDDMPF